MPKLLGYRERIPMNIYDAFSIRTLGEVSSHCIRLFGNANIGQAALSNMQVAGQMGCGQTAIVMNWYARTNMTSPTYSAECLRAWHAWTHVTTVTLVVGSMPVHQLPLSDLLGRREGQMKGIFPTNGEGAAADEHLAQALYEHRYGVGTWGVAIADVVNVVRDEWRATAREARRVLSPCLLAIIPVRQNFAVTIATEHRALRALQEIMPTDTAPQALVWVHLEGALSRDVG